MKHLICFVISLSLAFSFPAFAQSTFIQVYKNDTSGSQGHAAIQTTDGGYAVTGKSAGLVSYLDVFLMKTDAAGNMLWFKTYGTGNMFNVEDAGYDIQQTTDGGYVIAAESQGSAFGQVYIIKTNASGDTSWTRQYTFAAGFGEAFSIRQTTDQGYIVAGTGSALSGVPNTEAALLRLDENGVLVWCKLYGGNGLDVGKSVRPTSDGGFIMVSRFGEFSTQDIRLIRTDENGDTLWVKNFLAPLYEVPEDVIQTSDGGFLITGQTNSFGVTQTAEKFLLKTDADGNVLWSKTYGAGWINSVMETQSGYAFGGMDISVNGLLSGTDVNGNLLWAAQYGSGTYVTTYRFSKTSDGGFVTTGNFSDGSLSGLLLMKTNASGVAPCHYTDALAATPVSDVTFTVTSGCTITTVNPTLSFATVLNANPAPATTLVCDNAVSVAETKNEDDITVYPVPASDVVKVVVNETLRGTVTLSVTDMPGRKVMEIVLSPQQKNVDLDLRTLAGGTYLINLNDGEKKLVRKISVVK